MLINVQFLNFMIPFVCPLKQHFPGTCQLGFATSAMLRLRASCMAGATPKQWRGTRLGRSGFRLGATRSFRTIQSLELLTAVITGANANVISGKDLAKVLLAEARDQCEEFYRYCVSYCLEFRPLLLTILQALRHSTRLGSRHSRQQERQPGPQTRASNFCIFIQLVVTYHYYIICFFDKF